MVLFSLNLLIGILRSPSLRQLFEARLPALLDLRVPLPSPTNHRWRQSRRNLRYVVFIYTCYLLWLQQVEEDIGLSVGAALIASQDRSMWRTLRLSAGQAKQWVTEDLHSLLVSMSELENRVKMIFICLHFCFYGLLDTSLRPNARRSFYWSDFPVSNDCCCLHSLASVASVHWLLLF